jgi:hypothetical protein
MRIADLVPTRDSATLILEHGELQVEFRPAAIAGFAEFAEAGEVSLIDRLCAALISWDAEGPLPIVSTAAHAVGSAIANGEPIPIEPSYLQMLPMTVLLGIWEALIDEALPHPKETGSGSRQPG